MKLNLVTKSILGLSIVASAIATLAESSYAQDRFACDTNMKSTIVQTERGSVPLIRWVDNSFPPPFSPAQRCHIVSERFRKFDNNGTLKYIKADRINNQPVLCVAAYRGGSCLPDGLLVTFTPETDANSTLLQILDRRVWAAEQEVYLSNDPNNKVISQLNGETYVDIETFLEFVSNTHP